MILIIYDNAHTCIYLYAHAPWLRQRLNHDVSLNKYVKKYKSNIEAARQFVTAWRQSMEAVEKQAQWALHFLSLQQMNQC